MTESGRPMVSSRDKKLLTSSKESQSTNMEFHSMAVKNVFNTYPKNIRKKLIFLRELIYKTAAEISMVGELEETLKWGEPAYITTKSKSGTTIRLGWKASQPEQYMMYFNCNTTLIRTFRRKYRNVFKYGSNRALVFNEHDKVDVDALSDCIAQALTYHVTKKQKSGSKSSR